MIRQTWEAQNDYLGVLNEDNLADILKAAKAKKQKLPAPKSSEGNGYNSEQNSSRIVVADITQKVGRR